MDPKIFDIDYIHSLTKEMDKSVVDGNAMEMDGPLGNAMGNTTLTNSINGNPNESRYSNTHLNTPSNNTLLNPLSSNDGTTDIKSKIIASMNFYGDSHENQMETSRTFDSSAVRRNEEAVRTIASIREQRQISAPTISYGDIRIVIKVHTYSLSLSLILLVGSACRSLVSKRSIRMALV